MERRFNAARRHGGGGHHGPPAQLRRCPSDALCVIQHCWALACVGLGLWALRRLSLRLVGLRRLRAGRHCSGKVWHKLAQACREGRGPGRERAVAGSFGRRYLQAVTTRRAVREPEREGAAIA